MIHTGMRLESMEPIVSLAKRRGFVFPGSEIYGGFGDSWDYGPLGVVIENNVKAAWWRAMVQLRDDIVGLDAAILMSPQVWQASGHVGHFTDPLVDCKNCKHRFRADHAELTPCGNPEWRKEGLTAATCRGVKTEARQFNLMFKTFVGPVEETRRWPICGRRRRRASSSTSSTCSHEPQKLPFGIAQQGKAFRNEITPGNFIFRTREFEQMEMEYFVRPGTELEWYRHWGDQAQLVQERRQPREPAPARAEGGACALLERHDRHRVQVPVGLGRAGGYRQPHRLRPGPPSAASDKDLTYFDEETNEHNLPYVIEPAVGVGRATLVFLLDAYDEEQTEDENGRRTRALCCASTPRSRRSRWPCCRSRRRAWRRSAGSRPSLRPHFMSQYDDTRPSASATAARTRSARPSA